MPHPGYSLWRGSYPSAEMQSVYSTAPSDRVSILARNFTKAIKYAAFTLLWFVLHCFARWHMKHFHCYKYLNCFGWLVGFYGISTFIGYLMPNSVYIYNLRFLNEYPVDKILEKQDLIRLYTINWFQFIIYFGTTQSLSERIERRSFWRSVTGHSD